MAGREVFILCVSLITAVLGNRMQGGTISFRAVEKHAHGWEVEFKYKSSFIYEYYDYFYWWCQYADCWYTELQHYVEPVENKTSYPSPWYQFEGFMKRHMYSDKPNQFWENNCCWVPNNEYYSGWWLAANVDLGIRSDTTKPNTSPVTTIIPIIRIPSNCPTTIALLPHDPDADDLKCRYANYYWECGICSSNFHLDENLCTISVPSGYSRGFYVIEMILEDFPKEDIYLTYDDGSVTYKYRTYHRKTREAPEKSEKYWYWGYTTEAQTVDYVYSTSSDQMSISAEYDYTTSNQPMSEITMSRIPSQSDTSEYFETTSSQPMSISAEYDYQTSSQPISTTAENVYPTSSQPMNWRSLSRIPLQFLIEVTNPAPSCTFGDYRPRFLPPTPNHKERLLAKVHRTFLLTLSAKAVYQSIEDFKVSGPPGMIKSLGTITKSGTLNMVVEWTPEEDNKGEHVPVCFVAETFGGYQSELRCVTVVVVPNTLENSVLICNENSMTLILPKSDDYELYENQFCLNDPDCLVGSNGTHLIAEVDYNSCGTVIEETEEDIVFSNEITSFDNTSSVITRKNDVSIPFNCSFPKKNQVLATFLAHKSEYIFSEAGFGTFTYKFQFFTDEMFVDVNTNYPLEVGLRDLLYMEIQVSSSVPNVQLFVESCKATPHDNPNDPIFYNIIQNGCIKDDTVVVYPGSRTQYRFAMEAFAFIGHYPEVFISCTVILCKEEDLNTRCRRGCIRSFEASGRHKRSLDSETQQHFISQGPLRMKSETPAATNQEDKNNLSEKSNTLVIVLSGMATVALVAVTLNIYMKRAKATGYQILRTQEC